MYVCLCKGVTDRQIKAAVTEGTAASIGQLRKCLGVASQCGKCSVAAREILHEALHTHTETDAGYYAVA